MKKFVVSTIIANCMFMIGALSSIIIGNGTTQDYAILFIATSGLTLDISYLIYQKTRSPRALRKKENPKYRDRKAKQDGGQE